MIWPSLETTPKTITVNGNFVFITLGTLNRPDLHFEGAGNGPVVITWIGRGHELYSGASPISLVEHCVTFRHDRRLLSLLGFVHNWPTSRWPATKKENRFSFNENGIMSSFLGRKFYPSTQYSLVPCIGYPFLVVECTYCRNYSHILCLANRTVIYNLLFDFYFVIILLLD